MFPTWTLNFNLTSTSLSKWWLRQIRSKIITSKSTKKNYMFPDKKDSHGYMDAILQRYCSSRPNLPRAEVKSAIDSLHFWIRKKSSMDVCVRPKHNQEIKGSTKVNIFLYFPVKLTNCTSLRGREKKTHTETFPHTHPRSQSFTHKHYIAIKQLIISTCIELTSQNNHLHWTV